MFGIQNRESLDRFGPYGSAIGAAVGYFIDYPLAMLTGFGVGVPLTFILSYFLCTCTHRKYLIYSPGSVGGVIGALIGLLGIGLLLIPLSMIPDARFGASFLQLVGVSFFAFYCSRFMCNRAKRKEAEAEKQSSKKPLENIEISSPVHVSSERRSKKRGSTRTGKARKKGKERRKR